MLAPTRNIASDRPTLAKAGIQEPECIEPEITLEEFAYNFWMSCGYFMGSALPPSAIEDAIETLARVDGTICAAGLSEGASRPAPPPLTKNYRRRI